MRSRRWSQQQPDEVVALLRGWLADRRGLASATTTMKGDVRPDDRAAQGGRAAGADGQGERRQGCSGRCARARSRSSPRRSPGWLRRGAGVEGIVDEFHTWHHEEARRTAAWTSPARCSSRRSAARRRRRSWASCRLMSDMPFGFLQHADPRQVLSFVQNEHPQTIALVLAHLHASLASQILSGWRRTCRPTWRTASRSWTAPRRTSSGRSRPRWSASSPRCSSRRTCPASAACSRWWTSSTGPTGRPSASSEGSEGAARSWPRRSAAGCSSSRTSPPSRIGPCSCAAGGGDRRPGDRAQGRATRYATRS